MNVGRACAIPPNGVTPVMGENVVTYILRRVRDVRVQKAQGPDGHGTSAMTFEKKFRAGRVLEKTCRASVNAGPLGEAYHETHRLIGPAGPLDFAAVWAEVRTHDLLWATGGYLWRCAVHAKGLGDVVMVADLNDMRFAVIEAPFAGVGPGDLRRVL